jgi:uncharacterized protein
MKVAIIGAAGFAGSKIRDEALKRGHTVTAIGRDGSKLPAHKGLAFSKVDSYGDVDELAKAFDGHDAVIAAIHFHHVEAGKILDAFKKSGVKRLLVTGGAGSLEVAPGQFLMDQPYFPDAVKASASANYEFLKVLRKEQGLDWSYLSPPAEFIPGDITGKFRLGKDQLLFDANGRSSVTNGDYAVAMIDELEKPAHIRERFTIGY